MSCSHEFLTNAKIFSNGLDSERIWLVDCDERLATVCEMSAFISQDFTDLEIPTVERYADFLELLKREIKFLGVDSTKNLYYVENTPKPIAFVNQVAIQQLLSIATPQLASLLLVNGEKWDHTAPLVSATPRKELVKLATDYARLLINEVQQ